MDEYGWLENVTGGYGSTGIDNVVAALYNKIQLDNADLEVIDKELATQMLNEMGIQVSDEELETIVSGINSRLELNRGIKEF